MPHQATAYISGPMTGIKDFNAPMFAKVANDLRLEGWVVVAPHELDEAEGVQLIGQQGNEYGDAEYEGALGRDLEMLTRDNFTAVVFLPGWEKSGGAGREGRAAVEAGIPLYIWEPRLPGHLVRLRDADFMRLHTTRRAEV